MHSDESPASSSNSPRDKSFIIVTGVGRSGTSAVARVLHESGLPMGHELEGPSPFNPAGLYEDSDVWRLNQSLVAELGMWDPRHPGRWPRRSTVLAVAKGYQAAMRELAANALAGWKDPRFAVTLEAWLPHLPCRPKLVVCLRSPRPYADSVIRVFGLVERKAAERLWVKHYRRILDVIRDYKLEAACVEYDVLVERPREETATLAEFVGHPLQWQYVSSPLQHFKGSVPTQYARLYAEVRALDSNGRLASTPVRR